MIKFAQRFPGWHVEQQKTEFGVEEQIADALSEGAA
jgi:hypothetical protein